jgi:hypothetical protein
MEAYFPDGQVTQDVEAMEDAAEPDPQRLQPDEPGEPL